LEPIFSKTGRESQNRAKPLHIGLAALLYLFFAVFLVWPIIQIVAVGFRINPAASPSITSI